jgi:hypothetical protein
MLSLVLALGMVAPSKAKARSRSDGTQPPHEPPPEKQARRRARTGILQMPAVRSPSGHHVVEVDGGAVYLDGRCVHPEVGVVHVLSAPIFRSDSDAVAWVERGGGGTRLVVLPQLSSDAPAIAWPLPRALGQDRLHWAEANRVIVGPDLLQPRAVASWTEETAR